MATFGIAVSEVGVGLFAAFALWLIFRLREPAPAVPPLVPPPDAATAADLAPQAIPADELLRRVEESKYE
jgi:hypothetical protein